MLNTNLLALVAALSGAVLADLQWFSEPGCAANYQGQLNTKCGLDCTGFTDSHDNPTNDIHSVMAGGLEPNEQLVLYKSSDCSGDAYTAIGDAYGSSAKNNDCVASSKDGLGSFKILVYNNTGGGEACPPGSLTAAPTPFPSPTG